MAWLGLAWLRLAGADLDWLGLAWVILAWLRSAQLCLHWLGLAWLGLVGLGLGLAWATEAQIGLD